MALVHQGLQMALEHQQIPAQTDQEHRQIQMERHISL